MTADDFAWPEPSTPAEISGADLASAPGISAEPTRAEIVRSVLIWERVSRQAQLVADDLRAQLGQQARDELDAQGVAPSWHLPGIAKVTLVVSKPKIAVQDPRALTAWAIQRHPHTIETIQQVRASDLAVLIKQCDSEDGETVHIADDGEIIPGLVYIPGGQPRSLTVRPDSEATAAIDQAAEGILATIASAMGDPIVESTP